MNFDHENERPPFGCPHITEEDVERIAERAATKAVAEITEEVDSLPDGFVPNGWTYDAGIWASNEIAEQHMSEEEKAEVPILVTIRQARMALLAAGLLSAVNNFVASQSDEIKIYWEYSQELYRYHPVLMALGAQLGLSDQQIDALFVAAGKL